jgi:hypothetical protein
MYDKTEWIDHVVDPESGEVIVEGTRFTSQKMNKIEQGIADAHEAVETVENGNAAHMAESVAQGAHGLDETIAKYKNDTGIYTTRGTTHTVIEPFCTANSFVTVAITGTELPQGKWQVDSQDGQFTITSTKAEIMDIPFNYYITKAVGV